jgi:glycosyltransferase involved in cell wall biosynthesis
MSTEVTPEVSYVMASYNHEKFVAAMIESILRQTVTGIELVVVDDGSTDRTADIVEVIAQRDSRVRLLRQVNTGIVAARNRGIESTRAPFLSLVDSDDLLEPEHAQRLLLTLRANPDVVMAYGDAWIIDEQGNQQRRFSQIHPPIEGDFSVELFQNYCFVPAPTVMFQRSAMVESHMLWGGGGITDYLKWIELGLLGRVERILGEPIASWRHHGANLSQSSGKKRARQYEELVRDLEVVLQRHPGLRDKLGARRLRQRYAHCHFVRGYYLALGNDWDEARDAFVDSLSNRLNLRAIVGLVATQWPIRFCAPYLFRWAKVVMQRN